MATGIISRVGWNVRWLALMLLTAGITASAAPSPGDDQKGIQIAPVTDVAPAGSAALFVGINQFTVDNGLRPLNFAVDDAIAQAHLFVLELKLIPAANCYLAKSGDPSDEQTRKQLDELQKAGAHIVNAERTQIFQCLVMVEQFGKSPADLAIFSISSHGFEEGGTAYAMPQDGLRGMLADTALNLHNIEEKLSTSKAGKRLLLIDACREKATNDGKGGDTLMTTVFRKALVAAQGQAVLASCDAGQISYENPELHHGVFTYYLIQALRGQAVANGQGFITLGAVSDYVAQNVDDWVNRNKLGQGGSQKPWFAGPKDAQQIPLALDPGLHAQQLARVVTLKQLFMNSKITDLQLNEAKQLLLGDSADDEVSLRRAKVYVDLADGQLTPQYLQTALDAAGAVPIAHTDRPSSPAQPAETPTAAQTNAEPVADNQTQITQLLATARTNNNPDNAQDALKAINQVLELDPANTEANQLKKELTALLQPHESALKPAASLDELQAGADRHDATAMYQLGLAYQSGTGTAMDLKEGLNWLQKAAGTGSTRAMNRLGAMYSNGDGGVAIDQAEALKWFEMEANAGAAAGMVHLAMCYRNGLGVPRNDQRAEDWGEKALLLGAQVETEGDEQGMTGIALLYFNGLGVRTDNRQGVQWMRKAAAAGSTNAMNLLGDIYINGRGSGERDLTQAMDWYQKAAQLGNTSAMVSIGNYYINTPGVRRDVPQALQWYEKAADAGSCPAMSAIANVYARGMNGHPNLPEALPWIEKAAAAQDIRCMEWLANLYEQGRVVPKDMNQARAWYQKAANAGSQSSRGWLDRHWND